MPTTVFGGHRDLATFGACGFHQSFGLWDQVVLAQRLAHLFAGGSDKRVGDSATDDELINHRGERIEHRELGGHLGATDDRNQWTCRVLQRFAQGVELTRQQRAGAGDRRIAADSMGRSLSTVRSTEGIHHVHVAQRGHAPRQRLVVLLLAGIEAHVLAHHHVAVAHLAYAVQPILRQSYLTTQQRGHVFGDRPHGKLRVVFTLGGAPQMGHDHDPCAGQRQRVR